jgi:hypothetical protein
MNFGYHKIEEYLYQVNNSQPFNKSSFSKGAVCSIFLSNKLAIVLCGLLNTIFSSLRSCEENHKNSQNREP